MRKLVIGISIFLLVGAVLLWISMIFNKRFNLHKNVVFVMGLCSIMCIFIGFVGLGLIHVAGDRIRFKNLLGEIKSDLKLLVNMPYSEFQIMGSVNFSSIARRHKSIKKSTVFFFPDFKNYFDTLLNKIIMSSDVFIHDEGNNLDVDYYSLRYRLSDEERIFVVLAAQLIMKIPMLSIMYPKSIIAYISTLSCCSVEKDSLINRKNAAEKIARLLTSQVCNHNSWNALLDELSMSFSEFIKKNESILELADECSSSCVVIKRYLKELLKIAHLKYSLVGELAVEEEIRDGIDKAHHMIGILEERDRGNGYVKIKISDFNEETFDAVDIRKCFFPQGENLKILANSFFQEIME